MQNEANIKALRQKLADLESEYKQDRQALIRAIEILSRGVSSFAVPESKPTERSFADQAADLFMAKKDESTNAPITQPSTQKPEIDTTAEEYGGVTKAVRQVITSMNGQFTVKDVQQKLSELFPDIASRLEGNFSGMMWKLNKKEKFIKVVEQGAGRSPTIYVKS